LEPNLRLAHLYPKLMNIYGDRGNILCLERRCRERGIGFEVTELGLGEKLQPKECDLIVCWEHDWTECPIEVLELKEAIRRLPPEV